jgi:hypothetical protein
VKPQAAIDVQAVYDWAAILGSDLDELELICKRLERERYEADIHPYLRALRNCILALRETRTNMCVDARRRPRRPRATRRPMR